MTILWGNASETDETLDHSGKSYLPDCNSVEARLRPYAAQLVIVEGDSSYYVLPAPATAPTLGRAHPQRLPLHRHSIPALHRSSD